MLHLELGSQNGFVFFFGQRRLKLALRESQVISHKLLVHHILCLRILLLLYNLLDLRVFNYGRCWEHLLGLVLEWQALLHLK